jgi:type I restriction enzyme S subunit
VITVPLRHIAEVFFSNVDKKSVDGEVPVRLCNYTDVYYNDRVVAEMPFMEATATADQIARFSLRAGDVLLTKDSETADDIGISAYVAEDLPGVLCGYHLALVRPRIEGVDGRYLHRVLTASATRGQFEIAATGVTRFGLRYDAVAGVRVRTPELPVQRAIADYLDAEVLAMDNLLANKRRLIELLQERIDSAIMQLVGRSAVVEEGEQVPAAPIRRLLTKLDRPLGGGTEVITAFRDGQVTARALRRSEGFTESWTEGARVQGVSRGDVVIHGLDGFAGAIGTSEADGVCSPVYHVCSPIDGGDADFYGRMLRLLATTGYLGNFATSTRERAVDFRNWDLFGRIPIPAVEMAEQHRIGDRIRRLAPIRGRVARSEVLINERKQAVVTAALTGQLAIPGVAA